MREIKFRVWHTKSKQWTIYPNGFAVRVTDGKLVTAISDKLLSPVSDEFIYQQYTGLKDKNNKEIYEGDIIKFTLPEWTVGSGYRDYDSDEVDETVDEREIVCEVQIRTIRGVGMVYKKDVNDEVTDINLKYHWFRIKKTDEVIGNIYENPELIKESKDV